MFEVANEKYATDYPATVGSHMTNTDAGPFIDLKDFLLGLNAARTTLGAVGQLTGATLRK